MIWDDINKLKSHLAKENREIYMTSGGFDPVHIGHIRCIQSTAKMATNPENYPSKHCGIVVVVVNADSFLERKKGFAFMPLAERMEVIQALRGVDHVVAWEAEWPDQTVIGAIRALQPKYFTKGGDRFDASTIPEWEICNRIGCEIITGVGGEKIQSSSDLVDRANEFNNEASEVLGYAIGMQDGIDLCQKED